MLSSKTSLLLACTMFLFSLKSKSNDSLKLELNSLYNFDIFEYKNTSASGLERTLIEAYKGWYNLLLSPDNSNIADQTLGYIDQYMVSTDSSDLTVELRLNRIFLQQYKVRIHAFRKEQMRALNANLALGKMIDNIQLDEISDENYIYYKFISSAYDYVDSYLQEDSFIYSVISSNKIAVGGDMLQNIENCFQTDDFFIQTESAYFLMKAYNEIEEDYYSALTYSTWLVKHYPNNIIFQVEHFKCMVSSGIEFESVQNDYTILMVLIDKSEMAPEQKAHIKNVASSYFE